MSIDFDSSFRTAFAAGLRRFAARTGMAEDRLRRSFLVERLLARLLADAPDRWVRYDDWRLEHRYDGSASAYDASEKVSDHAKASVEAALRKATEHQGLEPVRLAVRHCERWPEVSQGPALAYRVAASDRDGEVGDADLLVGFAFPAEDEIEWIASLDVLAAQGGPPPLLPTRTRLAQIADRCGAYTGLTSRFPGCQDLLTIARFVPHLTCTAHEVRRRWGGLGRGMPHRPGRWRCRIRRRGGPTRTKSAPRNSACLRLWLSGMPGLRRCSIPSSAARSRQVRHGTPRGSSGFDTPQQAARGTCQT